MLHWHPLAGTQPDGEHLGNFRGDKLSMRVWDGYHAIIIACRDAWNFLINDPDRVRSIALGQMSVFMEAGITPLAAGAQAIHHAVDRLTVRFAVPALRRGISSLIASHSGAAAVLSRPNWAPRKTVPGSESC